MALLRHRDFLLLFAGQGISRLGDGLYTAAVAWLAWSLTHEAGAVALVTFAAYAPTFVATLIGAASAPGQLAARPLALPSYRSRTAMAPSDASRLFGQDHVRSYRETDGEIGHDWKGTAVLLLTTTGRRSHQPRTTPLIYGRSGDDYLVVASNDGSDTPPAWYLNLTEQPEVTVQVRGDRFSASARTATADERPQLWQEVLAQWPAYDDYQRNTGREIPVIVLEWR